MSGTPSLAHAHLAGLDLTDADLRGCDLKGTNLLRAVLFGAKLDDADLCKADLRETDLSHAFLVRARLLGTNLNKSRLFSADLASKSLASLSHLVLRAHRHDAVCDLIAECLTSSTVRLLQHLQIDVKTRAFVDDGFKTLIVLAGANVLGLPLKLLNGAHRILSVAGKKNESGCEYEGNCRFLHGSCHFD